MEIIISTVERRKLQKRRLLMQSAIGLFCERGIDATTMEEVAALAKVGIATLYRYFSTKTELVIQCATLFREEESQRYLSRLNKAVLSADTGIEKIEIILKIYSEIYEQSPKFLRFLQEFDSFVKNNEITPDRLKGYEQVVLSLAPYFMEALKKGTEDNSIELIASIEETYFTITHTLLSLMQKLAVQGYILASDKKVDGLLQIKVITRLIIRGLEGVK